MTADGRLVRASHDEHPELFWAVRGGGGNFGVVVSFEFQLHPVGPQVMAGPVFHSFDDAVDVLRFYRQVTSDAPDELACYTMLVSLPPIEPIPPELHGTPGVALAACYAGDPAEGEQALASLRAFGRPLLDGIGPVAYADLQQAFDAGTPAGGRYYSKAQYLAGLPDEAIEILVAHAGSMPGEMTQVAIEPMGGAIERVPGDATAYPHRDAAYSIGIWPGWTDPARDDDMIAWARSFHEAMTPYSAGGVYVNYLDADEPGRVEAAYGPHYQRLVEVKNAWDPDNLFRMNQNIAPAPTRTGTRS